MIRDARIIALLKKLEIVVDESVSEQQSVIEVAAGGTRVTHRTEIAKGHPANPLSDAELSEKFLIVTEPSLRGRAQAVLADLWAFEAVGDVAAWSTRLTEAQS